MLRKRDLRDAVVKITWRFRAPDVSAPAQGDFDGHFTT
jgi:hypothetical protein